MSDSCLSDKEIFLTKDSLQSCSYIDTEVSNKLHSFPHRLPVKVLATCVFNSPSKELQGSNKKGSRKSTPTPIIKSSNKVRKSSQEKPRSRRSGSLLNGKNRIDIQAIPNFEGELEKLLRAVFRQCIASPEFKSELKRIGADVILQHYAKNRLR